MTPATRPLIHPPKESPMNPENTTARDAAFALLLKQAAARFKYGSAWGRLTSLPLEQLDEVVDRALTAYREVAPEVARMGRGPAYVTAAGGQHVLTRLIFRARLVRAVKRIAGSAR